MKAFLNKYKWNIACIVAIFYIIFYFAPKQNEYYIDNDIKDFKTQYLQSILLWSGVVILIGLFVFWLHITKSVKQSLFGLGYLLLKLFIFYFFIRETILSTVLFVNRQYTNESVRKVYKVNYLAETKNPKTNFFLYDLKTRQSSIDNKLINKLYSTNLKQGDTVVLELNKGLLGMPFSSEPLNDK